MSSENPLLNNDDNEQEREEDSGASNTQRANASTTAEEAEVLIIKDCDPWWETPNEDILTELEVPYRVVDSDQVADETFSSYAAVLLPSTQPQAYYEEIAARQDSLAEYVSGGGVLIAHTMHSGWPCNAGLDLGVTYAPANVETSYTGRRDINTIAESDHPVVDGLSDNDFDRPEVSYNELTGLPDSARIILESSREEPVYVEYEYGDGIVLASGNPMEGAWAVEGHATPKQFLQNELEYALSVDPDSTTVSASVTTLQFIPGDNENEDQGGYPLNGGLMQLFREDNFGVSIRGYSLELPIQPVLDSWLKGDQTAVTDKVRPGSDELPMDIKKARRKESGKYSDEFGTDAFNIFRFENEVQVSFDTPDGETIDTESVQIRFNESGNSPEDERVSLDGRETPTSVTPDHGVNGIPVQDWHGTFEESSNRKPRHYEYETDFEFEGVEGVRILTISGGYAGFVADWALRVGNSPPTFINEVWDWGVNETLAEVAWLAAPSRTQFLTDYLTVVPNTYSLIEFIVLADGRRYARVWDASQYPSLAMYVDGKRRTIEKMPYTPQERLSLPVTVFHAQASAGITPYHSPLDFYTRLVDKNDRELFESMLADEVEQLLEWLPPVSWSVSDFLPRIPRETIGVDARGTPLDNPEEPFETGAGLVFPWSGTIGPA
jgi:hypothetical protein